MISENEIMNSPDRAIIIEYVEKESKQRISKIVMTTKNPKILYDKKCRADINVDELIETSENVLIIPIQ